MRPAPAVLLAALLALLAAPPAAAGGEVTIPPAPDGTVAFVMPSGNVGCRFIPAGGTGVYTTRTGRAELHCTRVAPSWRMVILDAAGHPGQPFAPGEVGGLDDGPVLPYGSFWRKGPFTCLSARAGLVCINADGHGLRLARATAETW